MFGGYLIKPCLLLVHLTAGSVEVGSVSGRGGIPPSILLMTEILAQYAVFPLGAGGIGLLRVNANSVMAKAPLGLQVIFTLGTMSQTTIEILWGEDLLFFLVSTTMRFELVNFLVSPSFRRSTGSVTVPTLPVRNAPKKHTG